MACEAIRVPRETFDEGVASDDHIHLKKYYLLSRW